MSQIREWFEAWVRERDADNVETYVTDVQHKIEPFLFPSEIVQKLREQALECENSERNPRTGKSLWPKETTLEWAAANLIEQHKAEIDYYEDMRETFCMISRQMREALKKKE